MLRTAALLLLFPLLSISSHLRTSTDNPVSASQLEKVGCHNECAKKAIQLLKERIELNVLFKKFITAVEQTVKVPRAEARIRTNLARDDLLGYVGRVWKAIAAGDVESAVTQQTSILESLEFTQRLDVMINTTLEQGPNLALPRGIVGGPVPNYRCTSGASLSGAIMPDGSSVCLPVTGFVGNVPVKCALFGMVPNSVLKTLGDSDFKTLCEQKSDCEYLKFQDDGQPGFCLAKTHHLRPNGLPLVDNDQKSRIVGGLIRDVKCTSGYARAGTFNPKRAGPHCVDEKDVKNHQTSREAARLLSDDSDKKTLVGTVVGTEDRRTCTVRHSARLFGVGQLSASIRAKRTDCTNLRDLVPVTSATVAKKPCCDPPAEASSEERQALKCEKELVNMLQQKEAMDQDISACTLMLHNSQCDTISPERRCGKKPWCSSKQVDVLVRVAAGSVEDCCSSYKCIARGFSDGREKIMAPASLHTTSQCPDFSAVSPLKSLEASGVTLEVLKAYKNACVAVDGCVYITKSNTCV
jgi:hypothetical protein